MSEWRYLNEEKPEAIEMLRAAVDAINNQAYDRALPLAVLALAMSLDHQLDALGDAVSYSAP